MSTDEKKLQIPAQINAITGACDFVGAAALAAGFNEKDVHHCQLAVDEACTNIIEHGYRTENPNQVIDIICQQFAEQLAINLLDDSPPFNPLVQQHEPNPDAALDDRENGGWGIYFIKRLMDEVSYAHVQGRNQLTMIKYRLPFQNSASHPSHSVTVLPHKKNMILLKPNTALDISASSELEMLLIKQLDAGNKYLVLDLEKVAAISAESLKMLVGVSKRARDIRGDLVLTGLNSLVQEVIHLTGFDLVFTIADSVEEALQRFKSKTG